jgi:SAM-dependent methyltransferase
MFPGLSRLRQILHLQIGRPTSAEIDDLAPLYRRTPAAQHRAAPLDADVAYAIDLARYYPRRLEELGLVLEGAHVLELGPGKNFGLALIFAGYGAQVTVADRFLCPWDENYHPHFYALLRDRWEGPKSGLISALSGARYSAVATLAIDARGLSALPTGSVDAVISHAVLEHVIDLEETCRELAQVTRPRGIHIHQIDYRDHRDQTRPLDHLLIPEEEFTAKLASVYWNTGNRYRHTEVCALFDSVGFDLIDTLIDPETERPLLLYLPHFLPQLRGSQSRYRDWPEEKLGPLGARLTLRKRP